MIFEVCLQTTEDAVAAQAGGAQRVELCAALIEGGITPSYGRIEACRAAIDIDLMVMIRPRGGDFLYTSTEFGEMRRDIEVCKSIGANGVVFGLLLPDGSIDVERTRELVELARPLSVTFHRAFDVCRDPRSALEQLIDCGIDRILTSGQAATVPQGIDLIAELVRRAGDRIIILPGCGVTPDNVAEVIAATGVDEFHATAFANRSSDMHYRNENVYMGVPGLPEYERELTSERLIRSFLKAASGLV